VREEWMYAWLPDVVRSGRGGSWGVANRPIEDLGTLLREGSMIILSFSTYKTVQIIPNSQVFKIVIYLKSSILY